MTKIITTLLYLIFTISVFSQNNYQWRHLNGPLGGIVGDIAVDSRDNIYAGVYTNFFYYYTGIFKSSDNGESWTELKTDFDEIQIYSIFIDENDKIYLGTSGMGLHLSDDYGETWIKIDTGYSSREWFAIGQSKNGTMFAGDAQYQNMYKSYNRGYNWEFIGNYAPLNIDIDENNKLFVSTLDSYIYSTNDGETWSKNEYFNGTAVGDILTLGRQEMLLGTGYGNFKGSGIYKSYNSGETWELKGLNSIDNVLSLNNDNSEVIYAGCGYDGLYQSIDNGEQWTAVDGWNKNWNKKQVFRVKLNSKNHIFIGSEDEGVYRSTDGGESFEQIGLPVSNVRSVDLSNDGNFIYTATPSGLQIYNRREKKWSNNGFHNVQGVSVGENGKVFLATSTEGAYFSEDNCNTWVKLPFDGIAYNIKSINDTTLLLASSGQLLLSRDEGQTWSETGIKTSFFRNAINFNNINHNLIILGNNGNSKAVFLSSDYCQSFSEIEIDYSPYENNSIAIDRNGIVYLASNLLNNSEAGIYKSNPPYNNWIKLFDGLSYTINVAQDNIIYAGTYIGVIQSNNGGENWQLIFDEQMPRTFPTVLESDINEHLLIGTYGYGLYELQLPTSINEEKIVVNSYKLYQNFPNPFNPSTTIKFSLPKKEFVKLKIYDLLGREITTLIQGELNQGEHSVNFDAKGLASGVYIYRLVTDKYRNVKKMILLR